MQTILIYHTCKNFCNTIRPLFCSTAVQLICCNDYNKSALPNQVRKLRPHYIFIEKRSDIEVMKNIIQQVQEISPSSKLILLGSDSLEANLLSSHFDHSIEYILNEQDILNDLPFYFQNSNLLSLPYTIKQKIVPIELLTPTEQSIVLVVLNTNSLKVKVISEIMSKNYVTIRTHLKSIYHKLDIHELKEIHKISFVDIKGQIIS